MTRKIKISVRFPLQLRKEMFENAIKNGYGMKGKSNWAQEALVSFLSNESFAEFVNIGDNLDEKLLEIVESFYFDENIVKRLDGAIIEVRIQNPSIEGVKSKIIRSSIIQRLLRPQEYLEM